MVEVTLNTQDWITNAPLMYMYNKGQELHIIGELPDNCEAHFSFTDNYADQTSDRPITRTEDGGIVEIPNVMFQADNLLSHKKYKFYIFLYDLEDEDSAHTFHRINVTVLERPVPDGYVPDTPLPNLIAVIEDLTRRLDEAEQQLAEINALVNDNLVYIEQEEVSP